MDTPTSSRISPNEKLPAKLSSLSYCLLMAIPAALAATVIVKVSDSFVVGFYQGAHRSHDDMFFFLTQFAPCIAGGFVFVGLGAVMTPKLRNFSVWIFATLDIAAALAVSLGDENGILGFAGQSAGAVIAATFFWREQP